jgi:putative SOS response-associated peptidase YedK
MLASIHFQTCGDKAKLNPELFPGLRFLDGGDFFPAQFTPVILREAEGVRMRFFRWGLVSCWDEDPTGPAKRVCAPVPAIAKDPAYLIPFRRNRCLIPADSFQLFDSKKTGRFPHKLSHTDGKLLYLAGIYDICRLPDGNNWYSFSIVTAASAFSQGFGETGLPVVLAGPMANQWIDPDQSPEKLLKMLESWKPENLRIISPAKVREEAMGLSTAAPAA